MLKAWTRTLVARSVRSSSASTHGRAKRRGPRRCVCDGELKKSIWSPPCENNSTGPDQEAATGAQGPGTGASLNRAALLGPVEARFLRRATIMAAAAGPSGRRLASAGGGLSLLFLLFDEG